MKLAERGAHDFVTACKFKQSVRVAVLRMLKAAITLRRKDVGRNFGDVALLEIIARQRRESIVQFDAAKRVDLAGTERAGLQEFENDLSRPRSSGEPFTAIDAIIAENSAPMKDMGRVMQALFAAGLSEGRFASDLGRASLAG